MSASVAILLTAGLVATACGLLGPFLVLRRVSLLGDAVSHAVLPGIVAVYLLLRTRAPLPVTLGAAAFAVACVLAIDALRGSGLLKADAAVGLVFPALFALGVLGVQRYADDVHLDLDSTIYGEVAYAPFRWLHLGDLVLARSLVVLGAVALADLALVAVAWKEWKATSFDPGFSRTAGLRPVLLSRLLVAAVAVTAVAAFESVGAILVVTMLVVPAATACLLTERLAATVAVAVGLGWAAAAAGHAAALRLDASIPGAMGLAAAAGFALALAGASRRSQRRRRRSKVASRSASVWAWIE